MGQLPWLVEHGSAIWKLVLVLCALLGAGLAVLRSWSIARAFGRTAQGSVGAPAPEEDGPESRGGVGSPDAARTAVQLVGHGPVRVRVATLLPPVYGATLGLFAGVAALYGVARVSTLRLGEVDGVSGECDRSPPEIATPLAVATPFARAAALAHLRKALGPERCFLHDRLEAAVALDRLQGQCPARLLLHGGQLGRAAAEGERCEDDGGAVVAALFDDGQFVRASERAGDDESLGDRALAQLHLLAGAPAKAARAAQRLDEELESRLREHRTGDDERRALLARCVTEAIRARSADGEAIERLRVMVEGDQGRICRPVLADLMDGRERSEVLEQVPPGSPGSEEGADGSWRWLDAMTTLLRAEAGLHVVVDPMYAAMGRAEALFSTVGEESARDHSFGGLERSALESLEKRASLEGEALRLRGELRFRRAVSELVAGRDDQATRSVEAAVADLQASRGVVETPRDEELEEAHELAVMIAIDAGDLTRARSLLGRVFSPHRRRELEGLVALLQRQRPSEVPFFLDAAFVDATIRDDGAALASSSRDRLVPMLRLMSRTVRTGRAQLVELFRYGTSERTGSSSVLVSLWRANQEHVVAQRFGERGWAQTLAARVERLSEGVLRRDTAVLVTALEHLDRGR